jgi:hypothetical protein
VSKLEFYARPLVAFDPKNKNHRRWYFEFVEYGGWGSCPVRFICPDDHGSDLTIMIKNMVVEHYIQKEFQKVAQKAKKTVDKKVKRHYNKNS